ncbi:hypothetical protein [Asticcacaulis endophyticus]|uniref:Uncharacterized protein n=1 Tax=Asticcacaulis endophyticus TaxID=1395890 RepID=A0A918Q6T4_9CAUL|nr:hypothetical protein [Asticcacaulis endophyticus]GGZ34081.1 hypothetical protein GCM10011273_20570 [Asticcacaulis endophyticus]
MSGENPTNLVAEFEAAYIFPLAQYAWQSERGRSCWIDLEIWQDALAGPIYSIINDGNCAYVYARNDDYFAGVNDATALYARLQQWHGKLSTGLESFIPTTYAEKSDLTAMRQFARQMWLVAEKAVTIERNR